MHAVPPTVLWIGAFIIVAIFGYGLTPWQVIESLMAEQGMGTGQQELMAFAAGYTLPLTVGFGVITYIALSGQAPHGPEKFAGAALILAACGWAAGELGLGLPPDYTGARGTGPAYVYLPMLVLSAYFNSYGFGLMLSALALGVASAVQFDRWTRHVL
jgi:hypothetical protein